MLGDSAYDILNYSNLQKYLLTALGVSPNTNEIQQSLAGVPAKTSRFYYSTTSCSQQEVVPVAPYNPRNTDDPKDIEYGVEDRIEEHSEDVQPKQTVLDETYNHRIGVERTNDAVKDCGLGHVHAPTQVFVSLCLRIVITNFEREDDPGRKKPKL